ncbi:2-amino-4-hydroxy-6-hydroxymethyldihydropteridine diphosphokinase [Pedobacter sp. HMWF019]|uniref:2-amino-4-hydroxy-6- hydroxymethyldihydropteridine diphosphokinase n=1 Tax=Pedobacter sp. HMWF019 TaxID=2056856 RepID=UPI000D39E151|nr:2-amino-4-hydroxy-6-hydroxymethyldihydropteridine diphosphokinase [Pedobacter sp. HMWF019]PTT02417.1 2-amino-4-hydroxy-6-hydroxymethyldihydropteridine diphosphokinase [Pedobacter sp. HMWF019]
MLLDRQTVYLLLGSNLGERHQLITDAIGYLKKDVGVVKGISSFYETAAWGKEDQPSFLNVAVEVETGLTAEDVLEKVLSIEKELGRVRHEKWGARLIDIDLILYGNEIIDIPDRLQVPHPQMQYRKFVLVPLAEIAGDVMHPVLGMKISEILKSLADNLPVIKV